MEPAAVGTGTGVARTRTTPHRPAFHARVGPAGWIAVALCGLGLALLTGGGGSSFSLGALVTLCGAACFAGHIAGLSEWATSANAYGLTAWSVGVAATVSGAVSVLTGQVGVPVTASAWQALLYVALAATCWDSPSRPVPKALSPPPPRRS